MALLKDIPVPPSYLDSLKPCFLQNIAVTLDFLLNPLPTLKEKGLLVRMGNTMVEKFSFDYETLERLTGFLKSPEPLTRWFGNDDEIVLPRFATHKRFTARSVCIDTLLQAITPEFILPYHVLVTLILCVNPGRVLPNLPLSTKVEDNYIPTRDKHGKVKFYRLLYNPRSLASPRWSLHPVDSYQTHIPPGKVIVFGNPNPGVRARV